MKKAAHILLCSLLIFNINAWAQQKTSWSGLRSVFSFHAGVTIPMVCFASDDITNKNAGFAKAGLIASIDYKYRFFHHLGVGTSLFWANHPVREGKVTASGEYNYFGLMGGPVIFPGIGKSIQADIHMYGGISNAYMPKMNNGDKVLLNNESVYAFTWAAGFSARFNFYEKAFVSFKADQTNLKPQFTSSSAKTEQHMVGLNLSAGIGVKW
jgi:hypothetical protein